MQNSRNQLFVLDNDRMKQFSEYITDIDYVVDVAIEKYAKRKPWSAEMGGPSYFINKRIPWYPN